ncbi:MAG: BREX system P-loop protein BrxC, partial [Campylobacterales bacterium]|nr:BREX system P-loop protein BrxC [Campylobacterales bacterium]
LQQSIKAKIDASLEKEIEESIITLNRLKNKLEILEDFAKLTSEQQNRFIQKFDDAIESIRRNTLIAVIKDSVRRFEDDTYQQIVIEISKLTAPKEPSKVTTTSTDAPKVAEPKIEYINIKSLKIDYNKPWLSDEDDVENYIELMKKALLKEIKDGKRVQV